MKKMWLGWNLQRHANLDPREGQCVPLSVRGRPFVQRVRPVQEPHGEEALVHRDFQSVTDQDHFMPVEHQRHHAVCDGTNDMGRARMVPRAHTIGTTAVSGVYQLGGSKDRTVARVTYTKLA